MSTTKPNAYVSQALEEYDKEVRLSCQATGRLKPYKPHLTAATRLLSRWGSFATTPGHIAGVYPGAVFVHEAELILLGLHLTPIDLVDRQSYMYWQAEGRLLSIALEGLRPTRVQEPIASTQCKDVWEWTAGNHLCVYGRPGTYESTFDEHLKDHGSAGLLNKALEHKHHIRVFTCVHVPGDSDLKNSRHADYQTLKDVEAAAVHQPKWWLYCGLFTVVRADEWPLAPKKKGKKHADDDDDDKSWLRRKYHLEGVAGQHLAKDEIKHRVKDIAELKLGIRGVSDAKYIPKKAKPKRTAAQAGVARPGDAQKPAAKKQKPTTTDKGGQVPEKGKLGDSKKQPPQAAPKPSVPPPSPKDQTARQGAPGVVPATAAAAAAAAPRKPAPVGTTGTTAPAPRGPTQEEDNVVHILSDFSSEDEPLVVRKAKHSGGGAAATALPGKATAATAPAGPGAAGKSQAQALKRPRDDAKLGGAGGTVNTKTTNKSGQDEHQHQNGDEGDGQHRKVKASAGQKSISWKEWDAVTVAKTIQTWRTVLGTRQYKTLDDLSGGVEPLPVPVFVEPGPGCPAPPTVSAAAQQQLKFKYLEDVEWDQQALNMVQPILFHEEEVTRKVLAQPADQQQQQQEGAQGPATSPSPGSWWSSGPTRPFCGSVVHSHFLKLDAQEAIKKKHQEAQQQDGKKQRIPKVDQNQVSSFNSCLVLSSVTRPFAVYHMCDDSCTRFRSVCAHNKLPVPAAMANNQDLARFSLPFEVFYIPAPDIGLPGQSAGTYPHWGVRCAVPLRRGQYVACILGTLTVPAKLPDKNKQSHHIKHLGALIGQYQYMEGGGFAKLDKGRHQRVHDIPPPPATCPWALQPQQVPPKVKADYSTTTGQQSQDMKRLQETWAAGTGHKPGADLSDHPGLVLIDQRTSGNISRLFRHASELHANLRSQLVYSRSCRSAVLHYIMLVAARDIPAGEELRYDHTHHWACPSQAAPDK